MSEEEAKVGDARALLIACVCAFAAQASQVKSKSS